MRDVLTDLAQWWRNGETVGLSTVVGTWKSAPRQPGASMLVGPDGTAVGSVSGGCVEGQFARAGQCERTGDEAEDGGVLQAAALREEAVIGVHRPRSSGTGPRASDVATTSLCSSPVMRPSRA